MLVPDHAAQQPTEQPAICATHPLPAEGPERFEDGTLPFLQILALEQGCAQLLHPAGKPAAQQRSSGQRVGTSPANGLPARRPAAMRVPTDLNHPCSRSCRLRVYERLGGPAAVQRHTESLRAWLYARLAGLRHSNGAPLLRIMGRHADPDAAQRQGATFNFQLLRPDGGLFSYRVASGVLAEAGFHMRCGCTCNPGACYGESRSSRGGSARRARECVLPRR